MVDADLENNLNYGESFKMLNCNLYLRSIRSRGAQEIILAIYCFVLFFKKLFFFFKFCLLLDQRLGFRKCTWYTKYLKKKKKKVVSVGSTAHSNESEGDKINDCLHFVLCIF